MEDKKIYECRECGKEMEDKSGNSEAPVCCNKPMILKEDLPECRKTDTAEHSRGADADDACDDSRAG